jgi:hypothetical protein
MCCLACWLYHGSINAYAPTRLLRQSRTSSVSCVRSDVENLVPEEGLEPPNLSVPDFESGAYTIPPFGHKSIFSYPFTCDCCLTRDSKLLPIMYNTCYHYYASDHFYNSHNPPYCWRMFFYFCQQCYISLQLAEAVGFEPTEPFDSSDFKSGAVNHLATLP